MFTEGESYIERREIRDRAAYKMGEKWDKTGEKTEKHSEYPELALEEF
jgi:hypothetical protein